MEFQTFEEKFQSIMEKWFTDTHNSMDEFYNKQEHAIDEGIELIFSDLRSSMNSNLTVNKNSSDLEIQSEDESDFGGLKIEIAKHQMKQITVSVDLSLSIVRKSTTKGQQKQVPLLVSLESHNLKLNFEEIVQRQWETIIQNWDLTPPVFDDTGQINSPIDEKANLPVWNSTSAAIIWNWDSISTPHVPDTGTFASHIENQNGSPSAVIVIGGGISGLAAAKVLHEASFKVILLESWDRLGGRIPTADYSFGYPVDLGASWLHGVCNENPLAPLIRSLGLTLYRTSGDDSVLYDHDLGSCMRFGADGHQVPQPLVIEVGEIFKKILKETEKVRDEHMDDMSILQAIWLVLDRHPELRQERLANEVLQWYICRMEAWFAVDADLISLKLLDQENVLSGGHGLMVQGYDPIIKALAKYIDIGLNHKVTKVCNGVHEVIVTVRDGSFLRMFHEFHTDFQKPCGQGF